MAAEPQPTITWELTLEQANQVIGIVGKQPFDKVADLLMYLRHQANQQLQAFQQQRQMQIAGASASAQPEPAAAAPAGPNDPTTTPPGSKGKPNGVDHSAKA